MTIGSTPIGTVETTAERGSFAIELAIGVLAWVLGIAVLATAYQFQSGQDDVSDAAAQAARAAAMTASPPDAGRAARSMARSRLSVGTCERGTVVVRTNVADFRAGGMVEVSVSCSSKPPIGPARILRGSSQEVIDRYRGGL